MNLMMEDSGRVLQGTRVQSIAKYVERIGDHATNLAELVVFMVKGKDIRHLGSLQDPKSERRPHGVLFLCAKNSARSQMAEGWALKLLPTAVRVWSAGSDPARSVSPRAVQTMQEVGVDISQQVPKHIIDFPLGEIDTLVTLCDEEVSVEVPGEVRRATWVYPDPEATVGSEAEVLAVFRKLRDDLKVRIEGLVKD
jgi:arsenate reductase